MRRKENKIFKQTACVIGLIASFQTLADPSLNQSINKHQ